MVFTADVIYTCNFWDVDQGVSLLALNAYVNIKEDAQVVSVNTQSLIVSDDYRNILLW